MKVVFAALAASLLVSGAPAGAQTQLDHNVQRTWDNIFNPGPPGDPRTNWERRRDAARYQAAQARREQYWHTRAERDEWCQAHPGAQPCMR